MNFLRVLALGFFLSSCVSIPKTDGTMEVKLQELQKMGKPMKELKSPWLAGGLSILLPGAGQVYAEDYGDAALTFFTAILVVPYFLGIIDSIQEARILNAQYTISHYEGIDSKPKRSKPKRSKPKRSKS